jgi:hypothetical protein
MSIHTMDFDTFMFKNIPSESSNTRVNPNTSHKKGPTPRPKTHLFGLETGCRIFGTVIPAEKTRKLYREIFLKCHQRALDVRIYPRIR